MRRPPIGIAKDGRELTLGNSLSIDWDLEDDLFEYETLGHGYSWSFKIPIKGNQWAFRYASHPGNRRSRYQTYEGFYITSNGNLWLECTLELYGKVGNYYDIRMTTIEPIVSSNLKTSIKNLIDETIELPGSGGANTAEAFNEIKKSPVVFPEIGFYANGLVGVNNHINNLDEGGSLEIVPCWKLIYLIKQSLKGLGYKFISNVPSNHSVNRLVVFDNKAYDFWTGQPTIFDGSDIIVQDLVPETTLSDLFIAYSFATAATMFVSTKNKEVRFINTVYEAKKNIGVLDLSKHLESDPDMERASINNIKLNYLLEEDDYLDLGPSELDKGKFLGDFIDYDDFESSTSATAEAGEFGFCKAENAYYVWKDQFTNPVFLTTPHKEYSSGSENQKQIECPYLPTGKDKYIYQRYEGSFELTENSSNGKIRIRLTYIKSVTYPFSDYEVAFEEQGDPVYSDREQYLPLLSDGAFITMDLDHTQDVDVTDVLIRRKLDYYVPQVGSQLISRFSPDGVEKSIVRMAFWNGEQNKITSGTYYCASPDQVLFDGSSISELGDLSLNTSYGKNNLIEKVWSRIIKFITDTVQLKFRNKVPAYLLKKLTEKSKVVQYKNGRFRFKKLKNTFTERGIADQEIEGYSL